MTTTYDVSFTALVLETGYDENRFVASRRAVNKSYHAMNEKGAAIETTRI